jgi:hypothetical protein
MMKKMAVLFILFFFTAPMDLAAFRDHRPSVKSVGSHPSAYRANRDMRIRLKMPFRFQGDKGSPGKPVHPVYPGYKPGKPGHGHPGRNHPRYGWSSGTTVVREVQPIIIVNHPAPQTPAAPPEPEKIWVPPVMGTRTEPGYWDHGIKKRWMGDHWRYEQDFETRKWVPESQVAIVEQEGFWKIVE